MVAEKKDDAEQQDHSLLFDLPPGVSDEDAMVLGHILTALQSLAACVQYRVRADTAAEGGDTATKKQKKGYLIHAALPANDVFELSLDDLLFLRSIHPARIESLTFARSAPGAPCELLIWVLDSSQPLMVVSSVAFFNATRTKKRCRII